MAEQSSEKEPRFCPECGTVLSITPTGKIRKHKNVNKIVWTKEPPFYREYPICDASGTAAKEAVSDARKTE